MVIRIYYLRARIYNRKTFLTLTCFCAIRSTGMPSRAHFIYGCAAIPSFITTLTHSLCINVLMHHTLRQAVQILCVFFFYFINEYTDDWPQPDISNYPFILRSNELTNNICVLVYTQLFNFRFCWSIFLFVERVDCTLLLKRKRQTFGNLLSAS